jgi:tripartite-type tricarboxylate transporter receptor subunit TctC
LDEEMKKILLALIFACNMAMADQPIEIVVPYPPGGATDSLGRIVSEILTEHGMSTVVLNKPGADAVIGANYAAKAKPDGRTLFVGATGALDSNFAFKAPGMEYNEKTFVPVVPLANISYVLAVPASSPIQNYEQFKFYVRANPEKFNLAFWNANTSNIFLSWAKKENLPKPNIVLYKGSGPQMIDLVGGHVPFAYDTWLAMAPMYEADKVRIIATLDRGGLAVVKKLKPNNESIAISDIHPELNVGVWYGLWAPAGTPDAVLSKMNKIINNAFKTLKYREKMELLNIKTYGGTAQSLLVMQQSNLKILTKIAQDLDK